MSQRAECLCNASRVCQPSHQRVHPVGTIRAKEAPVSHRLERVWEPVHEIHNCWLVPALGGVQMCVKKITSRTCISKNSQMCARYRTAQVCSSSSPSESIGHPIINNGFEFSINFLHLVRQSALLKSHFVKSSVAGPPSRSSATATGFSVALSEFPQVIIHTSTNPISVSVELSLLLLLLPLLSAA